MVSQQQTRHMVADVLRRFGSGPFADEALAFFAALGYQSDRRGRIEPNTAATFLAMFDHQGIFNCEAALIGQWQSVDLLFQLADDDLRQDQRRDSDRTLDLTRSDSWLIVAVELAAAGYTRSELAAITREINRLFAMPVIVLFKHGATATLACINRCLQRRDSGTDVLEKVTLLKDISGMRPQHGHIEMLRSLALPELARRHSFGNVAQLHQAWQATLDSLKLSKRFYAELADWYDWAVMQGCCPQSTSVGGQADQHARVIRLITRMIFVWFLKQRRLVPDALFDEQQVRTLLAELDAQSSSYYRAIVQNLFFAMLTTETQPLGQVCGQNTGSRQHATGIAHTVYRDRHLFRDPDAALALFRAVSFLNGTLFECPKRWEEREGNSEEVGGDSFLEHPWSLPNAFFFGPEQAVDLSAVSGRKSKPRVVRGLIQILSRYPFTLTENTPIEAEVALDPELLGQVFENVLAAYHPETGTTARKQTGSFYTPRAIVAYMVDESLIAYLTTKLLEASECVDAALRRHLDQRLRHLLAYHHEPHQFSASEVARLIAAIDQVNMLDPACGSGAFPIGMLHKLVFLLRRLDPKNVYWQARQIENARAIDDCALRERTIDDIAQAFARHEPDYGRKLFLIQHCIYGVDIQPIAVEIVRLRCFIALLADQRIDDSAPYRNLRALPHLETRFVAANALIDLPRHAHRSPEVIQKEAALAEVRRAYATTRAAQTRSRYREHDRRLRAEIAALLKAEGMLAATADQLAAWDPYDPNVCAAFFDPAWMFGIDRFDIVIGNPPYVRQEQIRTAKPRLQQQYTCYSGTADLYVYFYERGVQLLDSGGTLSYISSNKYFRSGYGEKLRRFLSANTTIEHLIDFGTTAMFPAIAYPSIITARKTPSNGHAVRALTWRAESSIEEFPQVFAAQSFTLPQRELSADGWRLADQTTLRLLEKLRQAGTPLDRYVNGRLYYGIKTGLNAAFVVDRATRDALITAHPSSAAVLKPLLRGRDVKRWSVNDARYYLIKLESSDNTRHPWSGRPTAEAERLFAATYPAIHARFQQFRQQLVNREDQGKYFWELRSCVYWQAFEESKIIIPAIEHDAAYAVDSAGHYSNDKTSICIAQDVPYLLGLLNSQVLWWFIRQIASTKQGGFYEFKPMYVAQIPIMAATPERQAPIVALVEQILTAKRQHPPADVTALEHAIDRLVYELYRLSDAEIAMITRR
jgi:hypothetical protein